MPTDSQAVPAAPDPPLSSPQAVSTAIAGMAAGIRRSHGQLLVELDTVFDDLTPDVGDTGARLRASLAEVQSGAEIVYSVPVDSQRWYGAWAKRIIRRIVGFYMRFIAAQVTQFAQAVARSLSLVASELDDLRPPRLPEPPSPEVGEGASSEEVPWWTEYVVRSLTGAPGRVLVGGAGRALLRALSTSGLVVYGVEPTDWGTEQDEGIELQSQSLFVHLQHVPAGSLSGAVIHGGVASPEAGRHQSLVARLAVALSPGGVLAVASTTPEAWVRLSPRAQVDFSRRRPLHAESWMYLLETAGFSDVVIVPGGDDPGAPLRERPPSDVDAGAWRALLEATLGGPDEYVVVGVKRH